tara:strand:- start:2992 stop:3231 length:240 start_codon:yes stop_codon:yes gene_type:complete
MFGIEINFKDGKKDWVDPVEDEPIEKEGKLLIDNGFHIYDYDMNKVEKWFKYDLCETCNHDLRTFECGEKCMNSKSKTF